LEGAVERDLWGRGRFRGQPNRAQNELDRSSQRVTVATVEPLRVKLSGDLAGDYVVEDRRLDGRLLLRPDLSVNAMLDRHGERELTPAEFEQHFGSLPADRD
jgi:hypothetical protein